MEKLLKTAGSVGNACLIRTVRKGQRESAIKNGSQGKRDSLRNRVMNHSQR